MRKYREFFEESHKSDVRAGSRRCTEKFVSNLKSGPSIYIDVEDKMSHLSNSECKFSNIRDSFTVSKLE